MPIPEVPDFESTLASFSLTKPIEREPHENVVVVPCTAGVDELGNRSDSPEITLWAATGKTVSIRGVVDRVARELKSHAHMDDQTSALLVVGLATLHPSFRANPIGCVNKLIAATAKAGLLQFFVLPASAPSGFELTFGSFRLGNLDVSKLNYWSQRAKSDFHIKYAHLFNFPRMALERSLHSVSLIPFNLAEQLGFRRGERSSAYQSLVVSYLDHIAAEYWKRFWHDFVDEQGPFVAFGAPFLPDEPLRALPGTSLVSVFIKIAGGPTGWVSPASVGFIAIDFVSADKRVAAAREELKTTYGFEGFSEDEVHQTLRLFMLFLARAERHAAEGRTSESFLHFIIALDLLFGDVEEIGRTVAKRVAAATFGEFGKDCEKVKRRVATLYGLRSKYVHRGRELNDTNRSDAQEICGKVLRTFLRFQARPESRRPDAVSSWLKNIDIVAAKIEAGVEPSDAELVTNGVKSQTEGSTKSPG